MNAFHLPDLGEGLCEAELIQWHVAEGDNVKAGQLLASVETDKALVELTSPQAGEIAQLFAAPGDRIEVGAPLLAFGDDQTVTKRPDAGTVVGELPSATPSQPLTRPAIPQLPRARRLASPAARALARSLGVDLSSVTATGPHGAIARGDVERAAARREPTPVFGERCERMRGVRLAMSRRMASAHRETAPATVQDEADVEEWAPQTDVTTRLVRAMVAGCAAEPSLNVWLEENGTARRFHQSVHVALAVQTEAGLFAPVLRDADQQSAAQLRTAIDRLVVRTKARSLTPEELLGATLTLSNFGTEGGRFATLVIVPPQVAILGAGRVAPRVVARKGEAVVRRLLPLSLTFDHRAVTGVEATRFLSAVIADLALPS
jgi:pyruvate dehydrogenase E2 component (dihydrolipoamide acetyltransferase)